MEVICKECDATLEICPDDIKVKRDEYFGTLSSGKFIFECLCCNRINIMSRDELSNDMRSEIEKRANL